jgi:YkoP domain
VRRDRPPKPRRGEEGSAQPGAARIIGASGSEALTTDTAASALGLATALGSTSARWPDGLWVGSVTWCDALLRSYYGIHEFTDDPACVLRTGLSHARATVTLSDGTHVQVGELVGTLHFWNEHLPPYSSNGPDLGWACAVRDRVVYSFCAFTDYIEREAAWQEVRAVRAETALPARRGAPQVGRVFRRYGFEQVHADSSLRARLHGLGECFVLWGLTRAFNPAALPRQPFLRDRYELWISRNTLRLRYARRNSHFPTDKRQRHGA